MTDQMMMMMIQIHLVELALRLAGELQGMS